MRILLGLLIVLFSPIAVASASDRPVGLNCNLVGPPANAGEDENHRITYKIYPRIADMPKNYSGCQTLWGPRGDKWFPVSVVAIEHGYGVRVWVAGDPVRNACRYKHGKLVLGSERDCPSPEFLVMASVPAGCMQHVVDSHGSFPLGCEFDAIGQ